MECEERNVRRDGRKTLIAVAAGLLLSLGGASAFAQPAGGHHGMHHGGGGGVEQMIAGVLSHAKDKLNLNTSQQGVWDNAVAQSKAAHEAARANRQQVKAALTAELSKPEPDLAAVAALADQVEQQNRSLRTNARAQWLQLYATLAPDQKAIVRDMLQQRVQRAESFGAKMRDRFQAMRPGGSQ